VIFVCFCAKALWDSGNAKRDKSPEKIRTEAHKDHENVLQEEFLKLLAQFLVFGQQRQPEW